MKPVALIGHDPAETFGVAVPALEAAGLQTHVHRSSVSGPPLPGIDEVSGLVVFGGAMNVDMTDSHPFLLAERDLVRRAVRDGVPFMGICLGAQMLARALDVPVFPAPVKEIGFSTLRQTEAGASDPLLSVFSEGDKVFHWHEDTFELPPDAVLLGTGDHVKVQAFRFAERAWGLQFHFEVDEAELELWLEEAGPDLKSSWGKSAAEIREEAGLYLTDQERRAGELFGRFADIVRDG